MDRLIRPFRVTHGFAFIIISVAFTGSAHATLAEQQAILKQYCISCHSAQVKSGGLALSTQDLANPGAHAAVYEKVVRKLRAGVMPPVGLPRPPKPAYDGFASWLESELDSAASAHPNPGRTEALHRLNRAEYQNAVRDLLGLEVNTSDLLPADDGSYGFDNIAGVLKVNQTLMERYLSVAGTISRLAIGEPPRTPAWLRFFSCPLSPSPAFVGAQHAAPHVRKITELESPVSPTLARPCDAPPTNQPQLDHSPLKNTPTETPSILAMSIINSFITASKIRIST